MNAEPKNSLPIQEAKIVGEEPKVDAPPVDEFALRDEWYKIARDVKSTKQFNALMKKLYAHDHSYSTIVYALGAAALAGAWCANAAPKGGGITGWQAGAVMWEFVTQWFFPNNKLGLRIWDYDELMYPQYEDKFTLRELSRDRMDNMIAEAKKLLAEAEKEGQPLLNEDVRAHWQSIADGKPPFNFEVIDDA